MSKFLNLDINDALKGFIVAFLSAALTGVVATLDSGMLPTNAELKQAAVVGLTAGLSYLLKNLVTNSQGAILKKD
jgi:VIT1/CCC1 family predicted Fe2+/Mn2+ transporter